MAYGDAFILTLFTNDPLLAVAADRAGVDRIGIDIERIGKPLRQGHLPTWISDHREEDLPDIRAALGMARLFARCNPIHAESGAEIERLLDSGVQVLMLPYFKSAQEVERFIRLVDGRAHPVLLLETREAAALTPVLCRVPGVREIHVGLNDMRLSLGWPSHFHVLASGFLERLCADIRAAGIRLGVGGVGRCGDNGLPIPSDLVIAQLPRLGATSALLSRAFFRPPLPEDLGLEMRKLRDCLEAYSGMPEEWLLGQRDELAALLARQFRDGSG